MFIKTQIVLMYILPAQTSTVTCFMTDLSSRRGGRPTTNKTADVLTRTKIWSWVPEGLNAKTDRVTVSRKMTLTLICP